MEAPASSCSATFDPATDAKLLSTLRCHFTEVAESYNHMRPWKHRHSLWWWLGHVHSLTLKLADDRRLCALKELVRDLHYHHPVLIDFVEQHQLTPKWRLSRCEEGKLAAADFVLHMIWKHCSGQGPLYGSSEVFPLFTLVCARPMHKIFDNATYHGLDNVGQIADWTLEWTPNGYAGVKYWGKHYDELQAKGARNFSLFASPRERMSQIKLSPPASPVLPRDRGAPSKAIRIGMRLGRPRPEPPVTRPAKRRRSNVQQQQQQQDIVRERRPSVDYGPLFSFEATTTTPTIVTPPSPLPPPAVTTDQDVPSWPATDSDVGEEANGGADDGGGDVNLVHSAAQMRLLAAKERKIEAQRQLLKATEDVQRARACLRRLGL